MVFNHVIVHVDMVFNVLYNIYHFVIHRNYVTRYGRVFVYMSLLNVVTGNSREEGSAHGSFGSRKIVLYY